MAKSRRVVLIDGSWLAFRAFFAIPGDLTTATGLPTNAIFGFATMFRKLFSGKRPDFGAVVFDAPGTTHRDAAYPQYKAHRPKPPPALGIQWSHIERVVEAHGFKMLRIPGVEGDDVIGTLAKRAVEAGFEAVIVASDKDFAQLVGDGIRLFDPVKDVTYDPDLVVKKWGVRPDQMVDLLALLGDESDNIPGVAGIGAKGAQTLLQTWGSLAGIYEHLGDLKGKQREALTENRENAFLSRELATIDTAVTLPYTIDELAIPEEDKAALDAVYKEYEFFSLLGAVDEGPLAAVEVCDTVDALQAALARLGDGLTAVIGLADPQLVGIAACGAGQRPFYVPFGNTAVEQVWFEWLAGPAPKVCHDAKALWRGLDARGAKLGGVTLDTMLASFLIDPNKLIPHGLPLVVKGFAQRVLRPYKALVGAGQNLKRLADLPVDDVAAYAGHLAEAIAEIAPIVEAELAFSGAKRVHDEIELPLSWVLGQMERDGIGVDRADMDRMNDEFTARKLALEAEIHALAGRPFNVASTQQLATVLFEELKLPVIKKIKTGYSTDAEVLERLAPQHPIAQKLLDHRTIAKLVSTYTTVLRDAVQPDGRIHATFQQTVGVSGRLISTDPDLQRTPVRTPEGRRIRQAFIAAPGHRMISADWSQIELRVLAHFSRDPLLLESFRDGIDVHRRTASELFGVAPDQVTPEQRNIGKTINFATIYGQGATALGQILGIPRKVASGHIERYFETYAGVRRWLDETIAQASIDGFVTTLLGRRRVIPELRSHQPTDRATGERIAANTPIQGSAADLCKLAMLQVSRDLVGHKTRMLLQVHDELVFEAPEDEVADVVVWVRAAMERPWPLAVPLVVNIGVGDSWGAAH